MNEIRRSRLEQRRKVVELLLADTDWHHKGYKLESTDHSQLQEAL